MNMPPRRNPYTGQPVPPGAQYKKIRMVRPIVVLLQQNMVVEETTDLFQKRVQDFMDDRREKGETEGLSIVWLGDSRSGITACVTYMELDRVVTVDAQTGEEVTSESPSGLVTPTQKKIVPIT